MAPSLKDIKYFLLDMDGTMYLDNELFDGTLDFLDYLKTNGKRAMYITNNSSRSVDSYIEKLASLGISAAPSDFCTSTEAAIFFLNKEYPGGKLFLLATPVVEKYFEDAGFTPVREYVEPGSDGDGRPDVVLLCFDTTLTYEKLNIACRYITEGVTYWATHPDKVCPFNKDYSTPDAGSFMACIETTTGKMPSFIAGKPQPYMINMIMEKTGALPSEIAVVGDRLNTDIASGRNAGVTTICVLSGETTPSMIEASNIKPDFVFENLRDLLNHLVM